MNSKAQIIYKLDGIDAEDGVDVFEITPILMSFGELIRSANDVLSLEQKIDIKVKPFREGSWITDFVIHGQATASFFEYFKGESGSNILILLQFLGLGAADGVKAVIDVIRFTKGRVQNYISDKDGETFTYTNESGEKMEISGPVHKLVQSPLIQNNYYNITVVPLDKFPTATAVSFQNIENDRVEIISALDKEYIEEYSRQELLSEVVKSEINGVYVKPKRGSYSGEQKAYSFIFGENIIWPTTIEDREFLTKLHTGSIRLFHEDLLMVDLEIRQKKDASNRITNDYAIIRVLNYIPYNKPDQRSLL